MNLTTTQKTYFKYIGASLLFLWSVGIVQIGYVYGEFKIHMLIIPTIVGSTLGYLLARQRILKDRHEASKKQFVSVVEMADEIATLQRLDGSFEFISNGVFKTTGYMPSYFYESADRFRSLLFPEDRDIWEAYQTSVIKQSETDNQEFDDEQGVVVRFRHKNGQTVWLRHRAKPIFEEGELAYLSGMNINFTEQVEHEKELRKLINTDQLTNLPNRRALKASAESMILSNQSFSLVMMDLDRFKSVNDSLGHSVGDALLKAVSKRLTTTLNPEIKVFRFGGDEFVFLTPSSLPITEVLDSLLGLISSPYKIKHLEITVGGSLGYVSYPEDAKDFETLVRYADAAMYQAKQSGENYIRYEGSSAENHERAMYIERNIDQAIKQLQIFPYFQPIYSQKGKKLVGAEALARWYTPEFGWVAPDEFIAIAESAGSIVSLGHSILAQSLEVYDEINMRREFPLTLSVNISGMQLLDDRFLTEVLKLLKEHQVKPGTLKLEVTETIFLGQKEVAQKALETLRKNGVLIALDDFGTGYSALSVLKDFSMDQLKLDKSFMDNIQHSKKGQSLVEHTIQMGHDMGLEVVAEGVEENDQIEMLDDWRCNLYQGFFLNRPMKKEDFLELCRREAASGIA